MRRRGWRAAAAGLAVAAMLAGGCDGGDPAASGRGTPAASGPPAGSAAQPGPRARTSPAPAASASVTPGAKERLGGRLAQPVTLLFTGDMLISDDLRARAERLAGGDGFDFRPMFAEVAPIIRSADWAVCHQETPISADNTALAGWPAFNAPRQLAEAERAAGYDACTTASNHTVDRGAAGVRSTLDTFDRVGIRHVGSARTEAEARRWTIYHVGGLRIGHLAYTYGLNGIEPPTAWAVNLIDPARIRADARSIRRAGAQFVVVSLHFGTEKVAEPSAYQRSVVDQVMAGREVDLVVGHHAHVVQPVQRRPDGRWILYGLGNFLAAQVVQAPDPTPPHRDGVIVTVRIARDRQGVPVVTQVAYVPTFVDLAAGRIRLAPAFSRRRTAEVLTRYRAPLVDATPR